jgi:hypothetical protein
MVIHSCHPSDSRKLKIEGSWFRLAWQKRKSRNLISKITRTQRARVVTQAVRHLHSKPEAQVQTPVPPQKIIFERLSLIILELFSQGILSYIEIYIYLTLKTLIYISNKIINIQN